MVLRHINHTITGGCIGGVLLQNSWMAFVLVALLVLRPGTSPVAIWHV